MDGLSFVQMVEAELKRRKIAKEVFYKESGISSATMSQWRKNIYSPSSVAIKKIEDYLGIKFSISTETKKEPITVFGEELPEDVLQNEKVLRAMKAFMKVPPELQDHLLATIEGLAESRK